jgi:O-antigen/teichoic acid export membrane protein
MMIELIIVLIVLIPVSLLIFFTRRKELKTNLSKVICQIAGAFMLVFGVLMLFPAFYMLFHGKATVQSVLFLVVSLSLLFSGYMITNRAGGKPNKKSGHENDNSWQSSD